MSRIGIGRGTALVVLALVLVLGPAAYGVAAPRVALDTEVTLLLDQEVVLTGEDLSIAFDSVRDDSRCPPDVHCVWEGDATVAVSLAHPASGPRTVVDLHTSDRFQRAAGYAGYRVELSTLNPAGDRLTLHVTTATVDPVGAILSRV